MRSAIRSASVTAGAFLAGFVTPSLAFMLLRFMSRTPEANVRSSATDEVLLVLYFIGVYALASGIAFTAITAASRNWRANSATQVVIISAIAGALAQIMHWTGLALMVLFPLMRGLPLAASTVIGTAVPGILLGFAVMLWSSTRRTALPVQR